MKKRKNDKKTTNKSENGSYVSNETKNNYKSALNNAYMEYGRDMDTAEDYAYKSAANNQYPGYGRNIGSTNDYTANSYTNSTNNRYAGYGKDMKSTNNTTDTSYRSNTNNNGYVSSNIGTNFTDSTISGVHCEVENCYYHKSGNKCGASNINIQNRSSSSVEETDCATFRHK